MTQISFPRNFGPIATSSKPVRCRLEPLQTKGPVRIRPYRCRRVLSVATRESGQLAKMAVAAAGREVLFGAAAAPACVAPIASVALRVASMFPVMAVQPAF